MFLYDALVLGLIQGLTEFLPISSSGHLVLMQHYLGLSLDPGILQNFDIVLHGGSLIAIILYFRKTWRRIIRHPFRREPGGSPPILSMIIIATLPVAVVGFIGFDWIGENTQTPLVVAAGFLFTGFSLIISGGRLSHSPAKESCLPGCDTACGWKQALSAGIGQAIAVLPGFSRSGLTIAGGRLAGLTTEGATRFAFLLGAPALAGALVLTLAAGRSNLAVIGLPPLLIGFAATLVSSLLVIHVFLATIRRYGVWIWSLYLFAAASLIIADELIRNL